MLTREIKKDSRDHDFKINRKHMAIYTREIKCAIGHVRGHVLAKSGVILVICLVTSLNRQRLQSVGRDTRWPITSYRSEYGVNIIWVTRLQVISGHTHFYGIVMLCAQCDRSLGKPMFTVFSLFSRIYRRFIWRYDYFFELPAVEST